MTDFNRFRDEYVAQVERSIAFAGKPHAFFTRAKARVLLRMLDARLGNRPQARVLDIGCGHGFIHRYFESRYRLTGVDVAGEVIDVARVENPSVEYAVVDGRSIPYPDATFDAAFMVCVLHHVAPERWLETLQEARRVLAPGALLAVFEHNPLNPLTQWVVRHNDIDADAALLGSGKVATLMRQAGLVGIERRFIIFTPFEAAPFRRLDDALGWVPLGAQYVVAGSVSPS